MNKMSLLRKTAQILLIVTCVLFYVTVCPASYIIYLRSGKKLITTKYWEEEGRIMFVYVNGVAGVPKESVQRIEESDLPPEGSSRQTDLEGKDYEEIEQSKSGLGPPQSGLKDPQSGLNQHQSVPDQKTSEKGDNGEGGGDQMDTDMSVKRRRKALDKRLTEARIIYKKALKDENEDLIKKQRSEIKTILIEIGNLRKELAERYNGIIPDWWQLVESD